MTVRLSDKVMHYGQILFRDLNRQHQEIVMGTCLHAIQSIEGRDPTDVTLRAHLTKLEPDHGRHVEFLWKGRTIVRVYAPSIVRDEKNETIQFRQIELVWKKRPGSV